MSDNYPGNSGLNWIVLAVVLVVVAGTILVNFVFGQSHAYLGSRLRWAIVPGRYEALATVILPRCWAAPNA